MPVFRKAQNLLSPTNTGIPINVDAPSGGDGLLIGHLFPWGSRGFSVQKALGECAANVGSKISLFVYDWHL